MTRYARHYRHVAPEGLHADPAFASPRSPLSPAADWPAEEPQLNATQRGGLEGAKVTTAAKLPPVDEFSRFELRAAKEFPDLMLTVGIANNRVGLGWQGRTYVLRCWGQPVGAVKLESKAASIEDAIKSMIAKVTSARTARRAA